MDCQLVKFLYCFIHCGVSVLQDCHGNPYPGHIDLVLKARQLDCYLQNSEVSLNKYTRRVGEERERERKGEGVI